MNAQKAVVDVHEQTLPIFYKKGHIRDCSEKSRNLSYAYGIFHFRTIFDVELKGVDLMHDTAVR